MIFVNIWDQWQTEKFIIFKIVCAEYYFIKDTGHENTSSFDDRLVCNLKQSFIDSHTTASTTREDYSSYIGIFFFQSIAQIVLLKIRGEIFQNKNYIQKRGTHTAPLK